MPSFARDPRLSSRNHVVVVWNLFFDSPVQILVLEKDHGVVVADRRFHQSLGIVGRRWTDNLQPRRVHEPHLRILRMEGPTMYISAARTTQHERCRRSPTVVRFRGHVDDLIEGAADEVHKLELGHGTQPRKGSTEGSAYDGRLRNRRINHALGPEAVDEAVGNFESAAIDADVLAYAKHARVALHLFPDSLADGSEVGDDGHVEEVYRNQHRVLPVAWL